MSSQYSHVSSSDLNTTADNVKCQMCQKQKNLMKCSHQTSANTLIVCVLALSHKYKNTKTAHNKIMCFHQTSAGSVVVMRTLLLTQIGHMSLLPSDSISEIDV